MKARRLVTPRLAAAALIGAFAWLLLASDAAQANEQKFCWGATVEKTGPTAVCYQGGSSYGTGIYAHGVEHSICVNYLGAKTSNRKCSSGPEQGVYLPLTPSENLIVPKIETNGAGPTKVYGVFYYNPAPPPPPPPPPTWHSNDNLGGEIVGDPDIASMAPARLDVFARSPSNTLVTKYFSNGAWSGWSDLGGSMASSPSAVAWGPGRLDVVARAADNTVTHWWYDGVSWHANDNLGGEIVGDPDIATTGSGTLHVFGRGPDGALRHKYFAGGAWSSWESLGGSMESGPGAVGSGGLLHVVARAPGGSVTHWWWQNGSGWHANDNLGGSIVGDPDIASMTSGRLDIFARSPGNTLVTKYFFGAWSGWSNLGGSMASGPGAVAWGPERLDVVARAADNTVTHWWYGS